MFQEKLNFLDHVATHQYPFRYQFGNSTIKVLARVFENNNSVECFVAPATAFILGTQ